MKLPVISDCSDCGACCERTPIPPFEPGEEAVRDVPDHLLQPIRDRIAADEHFDLKPCVWYDRHQKTCRHYELRPQACRSFEIGSDLCRLTRWDAGLDL
ncbi:MAG: YkgJ family cysteine cluster protein [Planctomycetaceae bacterium]